MVCAHVHIVAHEEIKLAPMEETLVCGAKGTPGWEKIPRNQAAFFLRSFLQTRGYYHPVFRDEGDVLQVDAGEPTLVTSVAALDAPEELDVSRYWQPVGERLTPQLLNGLEAWVKSRLMANGYGCPQVTSHANPDTGSVTVMMTTGPKQTVAGVEEEPVHGLKKGVLRRFDAFNVGEIFDADLLTLTQRRTQAADLVLSTTLSPRCGDEGVTVHQEVMTGEPRLTTLGFGFNTETLATIRGSIADSRMGPLASSAKASFILSRPDQEMTLSGAWYFLPEPSRIYLAPSFTIQRLVEAKYETRTVNLRVAPAFTWDGHGVGLNASSGPSYQIVRTLHNALSPEVVHITALDTQAQVVSHGFEYYASEPRTGFQANLIDLISRKAVGSQIDAHKIQLTGEVLYNVADWDPPQLVLGLRGGFGTTLTATDPDSIGALPPTWRHFLGGGDNVRGFTRLSLPPGPYGGLSAGFLGFETRLANRLPYKIQPLAFVDVGETSMQPGRLDAPIYWDPGAGVRWASPVGAVRLTAARGLVANATPAEKAAVKERWRFYFSFGQEF